MHRITGLRAIAENFDAMLIDQFGVLHNGQKLYSGTLEVLAQLKGLDIPVVILTNSGKRVAANNARMVQMGVPRHHFVDCVSSGEVAYQSLAVKRAYLIGKAGEDYGFDPIVFVDNPEDAEVMLILGSNAPKTSREDYRHLFQGLTLPALCCNPDKLMMTSQGLQMAPGAIAALYEEMGGAVKWIGKPYRAIYNYALTLVGRPQRVLCIGDSSEHDVVGGRGAGLSTLLVQQGVSAGLAEADFHAEPDFVMTDFQW